MPTKKQKAFVREDGGIDDGNVKHDKDHQLLPDERGHAVREDLTERTDDPFKRAFC